MLWEYGRWNNSTNSVWKAEEEVTCEVGLQKDEVGQRVSTVFST